MRESAEIKGLGLVGYIADLHPVDLPPNGWSTMQNIRCVDGSLSPFGGSEKIATITLHPETIAKVKSSSATYIAYAEGTKIKAYFAGAEIDISKRSYISSGRWDSCNLGGVGIFTNGAENPQYWGGAGTCEDLPFNSDSGCTWTDLGMTAKIIRAFKNHLFALDVTDCSGENRRRLRWSHPADPGTVPITWDITDPTKDAGDNELDDTPGAILDGLTLRDTLQIYKEDAVYSATFTGDTYIFNFRLVSREHGIYARNCVCDIGGKHFLVSDGDIYLYDGVNFESIADRRVRNLFFDNVSRTWYDRSFATFNQRLGEVWLCYPEANHANCNKALVWNMQDNTWSARDLPEIRSAIFAIVDRTSGYTWATLPYAEWDDWGINPSVPSWTSWGELLETSPIADSLILGGENALYEMERTNQDDGVNMTCYAQRTHLDVLGPDDWHTIYALYLNAEGDPFSVRVGRQQIHEGEILWSNYQTWTPGVTKKLNFLSTGRLHALEFYSSADVSWKVSDLKVIYGRAGGGI